MTISPSYALAPPSADLRFVSLTQAAALAAATLALKRKEEEANLTPQQKIDRAKQAERAHLLQTCMELGVEIYDVSVFRMRRNS
jgi:hypothetical protein